MISEIIGPTCGFKVCISKHRLKMFPFYPPRYGLENYYIDREMYNVYEIWDTETDGWFIERDKSIVERTPRVWADYELEEFNYHYLNGLEERLKRVRFATVMQIFQKRFPKNSKRVIL